MGYKIIARNQHQRVIRQITLEQILGPLVECTMYAFYILNAAGTISLQKSERSSPPDFINRNVRLTAHLTETTIGMDDLVVLFIDILHDPYLIDIVKYVREHVYVLCCF